jgi:hypothetical protein
MIIGKGLCARSSVVNRIYGNSRKFLMGGRSPELAIRDLANL